MRDTTHLARIVAASALAALAIVVASHVGAPRLTAGLAFLSGPKSEVGALVTEASPAYGETMALSPAGTVRLDRLEQHLLDLLNAERIAQGLGTLEPDQQLVDLARQRSNDMATRGYFGHVTPEGIMVFKMMDEAGIPYQLAGENLARNSYPPEKSPEVAHQGFMNSPKHRENDLEPRFDRVGIGVAVSPKGLIYFTELFTELAP